MTKKSERRGTAAKATTMSVAEAAVPVHANELALLTDLRTLIRSTRQRLATAVNAAHTLLCWQVGRRLLQENLQTGRAAYGKQILATVSQELTAEFGAGCFPALALSRHPDAPGVRQPGDCVDAVDTIELEPLHRAAHRQGPPPACDFYAEQVDLLELDAKPIRVGEYLTELPPQPLLRERLHRAIASARESAARRVSDGEGGG